MTFVGEDAEATVKVTTERSRNTDKTFNLKDYDVGQVKQIKLKQGGVDA